MKGTDTILLVSLIFGGGVALADDLIIYPAKGQSKDQQEKDKYQCYEWAKGQTGFDPMKQPHASSAPPPDTAPSTGGSMARGALFGAVVGGISGDAGKGAAIGGLMGGMRSRSQQRQNQAEQDQWAQKQAVQYQGQRDTYNRAYSACLEPRGYSVK